MAAYISNFSTQKAETGGLAVEGYPWLHSKFKTSLSYVVFYLNPPPTRVIFLKNIPLYYLTLSPQENRYHKSKMF